MSPARQREVCEERGPQVSGEAAGRGRHGCHGERVTPRAE